jgi:hypothetical protein
MLPCAPSCQLSKSHLEPQDASHYGLEFQENYIIEHTMFSVWHFALNMEFLKITHILVKVNNLFHF